MVRGIAWATAAIVSSLMLAGCSSPTGEGSKSGTQPTVQVAAPSEGQGSEEQPRAVEQLGANVVDAFVDAGLPARDVEDRSRDLCKPRSEGGIACDQMFSTRDMRVYVFWNAEARMQWMATAGSGKKAGPVVLVPRNPAGRSRIADYLAVVRKVLRS